MSAAENQRNYLNSKLSIHSSLHKNYDSLNQTDNSVS